jgi:hypothetical protein
MSNLNGKKRYLPEAMKIKTKQGGVVAVVN